MDVYVNYNEEIDFKNKPYIQDIELINIKNDIKMKNTVIKVENLYLDKQYDEAIRIINNTKNYRNCVELMELKAIILMSDDYINQNIIEAKEYFSILEEINPKKAIVKEGLGTIYFKCNEIEKSVGYFREAIYLDLSNIEYRKKMVFSLIKTNSLSEALEVAYEANKANSDDLEILQCIAFLEFHMNNLDKAIIYFNKAIKINPTNIPNRYNLGVCLMCKDNYSDAIDNFNAVEKTCESERETIDQNNNVILSNKEMINLEINKKIYKRLNNLKMICYTHLEKWDMLEKISADILSNDRNSIKSLSFLIKSLEKSKNYNKEAEILEKIIAKINKMIDLAKTGKKKDYDVAYLEKLVKKFTKKISDIKKEIIVNVKEKDPEISTTRTKQSSTKSHMRNSVFKNFFNSYLSKKPNDNEIVKLLLKIEKNPSSCSLMYQLACIYLEMEKLEEAFELFEKIKSLDKDFMKEKIEENIGDVYFKQKNILQAKDQFFLCENYLTKKIENFSGSKHLTLNLENPNKDNKFDEALINKKSKSYLNDLEMVNIKLGRCFENLFQIESAVEYYKKALMINNNSIWAKFHLGCLKIKQAEKSFKKSVINSEIKKQNNLKKFSKRLSKEVSSSLNNYETFVKIKKDVSFKLKLNKSKRELMSPEKSILKSANKTEREDDLKERLDLITINANNVNNNENETEKDEENLDDFSSDEENKFQFIYDRYKNIGIKDPIVAKYSKEMDEGLETLKQAVKFNNSEIFFRYLIELVNAGKYTLAVNLYEKYANHFQPKLNILISMSIAYGFLNKPEVSLDLLEDASSFGEFQENPEYIINLALAYEKQEMFANAISTYKNILQINPNHFMTCFNLGNVLLKSKQYKRALKYFKTALNERPYYTPILFKLGLLYKEIYDYDKAISYLNICLEKDPKYYDAVILLGNIYLQDENTEYFSISKAEKLFTIALTVNENSYEALLGLATTNFSKGNYSSAKLFLERGYQINHTNIELLTSYSNTLIAIEDFSSAKKILQKMIVNGYKNHFTHFSLGNVFLVMDEYEKAIDQYKFAKMCKDDDGDEIYNNLGYAYFKIGYFTDAIRCFKKAYKRNCNEKDILINLGNCYFHKNQFKDAKNIFIDCLNRGLINKDIVIGFIKSVVSLRSDDDDQIIENIIKMIDNIEEDYEKDNNLDEENKDKFEIDQINEDNKVILSNIHGNNHRKIHKKNSTYDIGISRDINKSSKMMFILSNEENNQSWLKIKEDLKMLVRK